MMRSFANAVGLGALILSAGCSATSVPIHGSDGKPYVYVDCSGMFRSLDDCYQLANSVCPGGYRIANSVAPRANPFGNLVVVCQPDVPDAPAASASPAASDTR